MTKIKGKTYKITMKNGKKFKVKMKDTVTGPLNPYKVASKKKNIG